MFPLEFEPDGTPIVKDYICYSCKKVIDTDAGYAVDTSGNWFHVSCHKYWKEEA